MVLCLSLCVCLTGCVSNGLPVTDSTPAVTLPPAQVQFVAPIGDASLEYTEEATLYLPSRDGISLTKVTAQVSYSPVRPDAETLVRTLIAHAGTKEATALGGDTRLSLYGTSPVEVSRNTVTVNLSASALQLDRESLFLTCQAIANTLTELDGIEYVNVLVVDKPVGLDIGNTLPMGALKYNGAQDLGAVYNQLLSRRSADPTEGPSEPFSANVTLYFPLNGAEGMVSEVRSLSFENQVFSDMVKVILREMAAGPVDQSIHSPTLPLLADLLTATPTLSISNETSGSVITLDFAHNLDDMLEAYGISRKQSMGSMCYTLATFFPNVSGIRVTINGAVVDEILLTESDSGEAAEILLRSDFSSLLLDYCTLFFPTEDEQVLVSTQRAIPYRQCNNPRTLLCELSKGPQASDSRTDLLPVMAQGSITDTDLLGFSLAGDTLLVNFSPTFSEIGTGMDVQAERNFAYAMVNTLCANDLVKSICFFQSGSQFDGFSGEIYWAGLFYPLPNER